jgi:hypothetical protein
MPGQGSKAWHKASINIDDRCPPIRTDTDNLDMSTAAVVPAFSAIHTSIYDTLEALLEQGTIPQVGQCRDALYQCAQRTPIAWDELLQVGEEFGKEIVELFLADRGVIATYGLADVWEEGLQTLAAVECFPFAEATERVDPTAHEPRPKQRLDIQLLPQRVLALVIARSAMTERQTQLGRWHVMDEQEETAEQQAHVLLADISWDKVDWVHLSRLCQQMWRWLLSGRPMLIWGLSRFDDIAAFRQLSTWFHVHVVGGRHWIGAAEDIPRLATGIWATRRLCDHAPHPRCGRLRSAGDPIA